MRVWSDSIGAGERTPVVKIFAAAQLREACGCGLCLICAPETAETKQLIGAAEIARMKRGARVINVGRGSLLDEVALFKLWKGALGGAALDVAQTEPLPAESRCGKRRI